MAGGERSGSGPGAVAGIRWRPFVALVALGTLAYANTLDVPFYLDDGRNVERNPHIRIESLDPGALLDAALESPSPRPVANLSFALNHLVAGDDLAAYHAVNIAIHCANGILVFLLARILYERRRRLQGQRPPRPAHAATAAMALFAAAVFVAHPLQTQSVTYVVQRMTGLAAFFSLLAIVLFAHGRTAPAPGRRALLWAGSALSWVLAVGSKQNAAVLPLVLWLVEWFFFQDLDRRWLRRGLPLLLAPLAAGAALAWLYLGADPLARLQSGYAVRDFGPVERLLTQPRVFWLYASLMLAPLPSRLNLLHAIAPSSSLLAPAATAPALLALAGLLVLVCALARRYRMLSFGLLWLVVWQLVESTILPLELVFEHRCYLPLAGFAWITAEVVFSLPGRRLAPAAGALLVALLAAGTFARNELWRDPVAFWSDVVAKSPREYRARNQLGLELGGRGRTAEAVVALREAVAIDPGQFGIHNNLGAAEERAGDVAAAIASYREAIRLAPDFHEGYQNLALAYERAGDSARAAAVYRELGRRAPDLTEAAVALGSQQRRRGALDAAVRSLERALRAQPDHPRAHNELGLTFAVAGDFPRAITHFRAAAAAEPGWAEPRNNLAAALVRSGHPEEALSHYREALLLAPRFAEAHNNLGALYASLGDMQSAARSFREALRIDPSYADARHNLDRARKALAATPEPPHRPGETGSPAAAASPP